MADSLPDLHFATPLSSSTQAMEHSPPTKPGTKRLLIVLSVLSSFLLGSPFLLKATEIYRTPLPFASIEEHAQKSSLVFPCYFRFVFTSTDKMYDEELILKGLNEVSSKLSQSMHRLITENNSSYGGCSSSFGIVASLDIENGCWSVGAAEGFPVWPCGLTNSKLYDVVKLDDNNMLDAFLNSYSFEAPYPQEKQLEMHRTGVYTILSITRSNDEINDGNNIISPLKAVIGKYRNAWIMGAKSRSFADEEALSLMSEIAVKFFMNGGSYQHQSIEEKGSAIPIAADGKAILSFSLLNAQPKDWIFHWDFNKLEKQFLAPVVEALKPIAELSIESQILYYTPSNVRSYWDSKKQKHLVLSRDIPFFVNSNEWHIDTSTAAAGRSKLLHFAIYIPAVDEYPLHLKNKDGSLSKTNAFTSPGWGGVIIFNPLNCKLNMNKSIQHLSVEDLKSVMLVVITQIRDLFGFSSLVSANKDRFVQIPAVSSGFTNWEQDVLIRRRAIDDIKSSASTLRSLSHLVQSLPNMVVMEEIGNQVRSSLLAAKTAQENASNVFYFITADAARRAKYLAEEAFFQPSLMSLLYLPLEHHFAIYTPFFVPVLLHTVLAVIKEIRRYRKRQKSWRNEMTTS